jgi:precorrin-6A/cobalt-precorrin-6A reductase
VSVAAVVRVTRDGRKLEAARQSGVPIAMVDRPPAPDMPAVADVTAAMAWLHDLTSTAA